MPAQPISGLPTSKESAKTLADVLVVQGALDQARAKHVNLAEIQTGKSQEEIIKSQKLVNEQELTKAKATLYNVPFINLGQIPTSPEALATLPQEVATRFKVFPVSIDAKSKELIIAMENPLDLTAIEFIEQKTGLRVKPHAAEPSLIEELLATGYASSLAREVTEALKEVTPEEDRVRTLEGKTGLLGAAGTKAPVIREERVAEIVNHILSFAIKARASDVHIEPQEHATRVRYRIDGILQEKLTTPRGLHDALVSRIKILSGMKIDEKRIPQDGRFNFIGDEKEVDLRVSTLPTSWGEKVVMRLLQKTGGVPSLPELGLRGRALKNLEDAILRPHGIIIICGPTGSGKTTTLYSIIQKINTPKINIVTLEDPIEYYIRGVNQSQINANIGYTFASGLRSILRQDPNIIMLGEIRDKETTELVIHASLTGHMILSTLHTNNAVGAIPRLVDLGAEPFLLSSVINIIIAQRLARKICPDCKHEIEAPEALLKKIKEQLITIPDKYFEDANINKNQLKFMKGKGCAHCGNLGYQGRVAVAEVIVITPEIRKIINDGTNITEISKFLVKQDFIRLNQDCLLKAMAGITTLDEVVRVSQL